MTLKLVSSAVLMGALLLASALAQADDFDINDANTWATATILSLTGGDGSGGPGTYTQTWSIQWNTEAAASLALADYNIVGFEWQPDGNAPTPISATDPTGWAYLNPNDGFLGTYANGDGSNFVDATSFGLGVDYQGSAYEWTFTFETYGDLNAMNYHIQFAYLGDNGDNPTIRYHLGMAYYKAGETALAKEELRASLKLSKDFEGAEEARKALDKL